MNWITLSLGGFLLMGVGNFLARLATQHGLSGIATTAIIFTVDFIVALAIVAARRPAFAEHPTGLVYAGLAGVVLAGALLLLMVAYNQTGVHTGTATAIVNANFALVALLALLFLGEPITVKQWVGFAAILAGMFLLV